MCSYIVYVRIAKTRPTYVLMLHYLVRAGAVQESAYPASIMKDFEKAAINAFTALFRQADVSGCYFQLGQSAWRRIQGLSLPTKYREDPAWYDYSSHDMQCNFI